MMQRSYCLQIKVKWILILHVKFPDKNKINNGEIIANINQDSYKQQKWHPDFSLKQYNNKTITKDRLIYLAQKINNIPHNLKLQPQVKKVLNDRIKMAEEKIKIKKKFRCTLQA